MPIRLRLDPDQPQDQLSFKNTTLQSRVPRHFQAASYPPVSDSHYHPSYYTYQAQQPVNRSASTSVHVSESPTVADTPSFSGIFTRSLDEELE